MVQDKIPVSISKLRHFYPFLDDLFNKYKSGDKPLLLNMDILLEIDEGEQDSFEGRYLDLIKKYNIPNDAIGDVLYINQKVFHDLTILDTIRHLDKQTQYALDFLIGYQKLVAQIDFKKKQNKPGYRNDDPLIVQIKDKFSNGAVPLFYEGSGRPVVKLIYEAFKTSFNNVGLNSILETYPDIPPLDKLISLKSSITDSRKLVVREMLGKTASILSAYFERHIPYKVYSRKKNLIIYELFYLFDTLKYAGKVMDIDSSNLKRINLKTDYGLPLDKSKHADFIKEVIKNDNRRGFPLSGAFLTFTKA